MRSPTHKEPSSTDRTGREHVRINRWLRLHIDRVINAELVRGDRCAIGTEAPAFHDQLDSTESDISRLEVDEVDEVDAGDTVPLADELRGL